MRFILGYLKPYAGRCVLFVLLTVLSVLFTMATALSVADFLRILFDTGIDLPVSQGNLLSAYLDRLYRWLIGFGQLKALLLFSAIIFVLYALKNVFGYLSKLEISIIRTHVVRDLRNQLFRRVMRLPMSYFDRNRKGDILSRFGSDMAEMEESTINSVQSLIGALISMLLYMAMLIYLSPQLTLFVLCMLPLVALSAGLVSRRLRKQSKEVQEMNSTLVSMTDEAISGLKVIKSYTAIDFSNSRFAQFNHSYAHQRTAMFRRIMSASPVSDFMGNVIVVGILIFGSYLIFGGNTGLTAELFISYIMLFVLMIPPVKDLTTSFSQMRKGRACVDRIEALLAEPEEQEVVNSTSTPTAPDKTAPVVEFCHVDFSYIEGTPVLTDFNLTIPRGHTVALVGSSGSGKSTVADLVGRYYLPTAGEIRFCGQPIGQIPLTDLRSHIGVVAQETLLFNDTVCANIAFGRPDATDADIERAARAAQAHDFIMQLPEGYQTNLGENGSLLSGGQRQRISIARALLREPDLLVLDEATSALDTEAERRLQQTLDTLLRDHTALVIAHRLSTVRHADQIIVLDQGRVVEHGTHTELMARGGRYAELVALQALQDTPNANA